MKDNKVAIKNKGFTLIELIVSIAILGIITMLALPAVQNLQEENAKGKFDQYANTLKSSAKLYTDSYSDDMFGKNESGCYDVKFSEMSSKNLVKDLKVNGNKCSSDDTFVRVRKSGERYTYEVNLVCVNSANQKVYPTKEDKKNVVPTAVCDGTIQDNVPPKISIVKNGTNGWSNKTNEVINVVITDEYGLKGALSVDYAWVKPGANPTSYEKLYFSNPANVVTAKQKVIFPLDSNKKLNGQYELVVAVNDHNNVRDVNNNSTSIAPIRSKVFKYDTDKPECDGISKNDSWTTSNVTINIKCKDNLSGCVQNPYQQTFKTGTIPTKSIVQEIYDNANNMQRCSSNGNVNIKLDKEAPSAPTTGAIGDVSGSNATGTIQTAAGGSKDPNGGSGVAKYLYCVTNSSTVPANTNGCFKESRNFTRSCGKSYYGWAIAVDKVGNRSSVKALGKTSDGADSYGSWTACSKSCGTGSQSQTNSCALKPKNTRNCNTHACCTSTKESGNWYDTSTCNKSCGSGTKNQAINLVSTYTGESCGTKSRTVSCNTQSCCSSVKDSGSWYDTSSCSKSCGTGSKNQAITTVSTYTGQVCGTRTRSVSCNTRSCCSSTTPSGNWYNVNGCSASCGGGSQRQDITMVSTYNGQGCGTSTRYVACNTGSCAPHLTCWRDGALGAYRSDNGYYQRAWDYTLSGYTSGNAGGNPSGTFRTGYGELVQQDNYQWCWSRSTWVSQGANGRDPGTGQISNWCGL